MEEVDEEDGAEGEEIQDEEASSAGKEPSYIIASCCDAVVDEENGSC